MATALVISQSELARDPRVYRQIRWLVEQGYEVDTLGLGVPPIDGQGTHFRMAPLPALAKPRVAKGIIHTLLPFRTRFRILSLSRIPKSLLAKVRSTGYDLTIFNDIHLMPLLDHEPAFTCGRLHLDLHEYHPAHLPAGAPFRAMVDTYYAWGRAMITNPGIDSRSTVAGGIAKLYRDELGLPDWSIIRNAPDAEKLKPSPVDGDNVRLIHHGVANWERGLREMLGAMRLLPERFSLTFMLIGTDEMKAALAAEAADLGDRVRIVPPAPMTELSATINPYDLEVMFYPPKTRNLEFALPNKLFEAVQGRLGLVTGESPMMAEIVREFGNGVIATGGWTAEDLARALEPIDGAKVAAFKKASDKAAAVLNSDHEKQSFLTAVGAVRS